MKRKTPSRKLKQRIIDELGFDVAEGAEGYSINYHDSRNIDRVARWGMRDGNRYFWSYATVTELLQEKEIGVCKGQDGSIQIY